MLDYAKNKEIKLITAEIKEDNLASKRIWEKNGAETELIGNRFLVSILLKY
jgi:predicted acetyltransferase